MNGGCAGAVKKILDKNGQVMLKRCQRTNRLAYRCLASAARNVADLDRPGETVIG